MTENLRVSRVVFSESGGMVIASEDGLSPNPLEYAPKGTLKALIQARDRIKELEAELTAANKRLAEAEGFGIVISEQNTELMEAVDRITELEERLKELEHPDFVLVRRKDLSLSLRCTDYGPEKYEDIKPRMEVIDRLKAALDLGQEMPEPSDKGVNK